MIRKSALLLLLVFVLGLFCGCVPPDTGPDPETFTGPKKVIITDQKNSALRIYDLNNDDWSKPEWEWTIDAPTFTHVDGVKYRFDPLNKMNVIALCSSGGYAAVVTYPGGEVLSYVPRAGNNPHSVEILPDGALVVASSTGNTIRIYDTSYYGDISEYYTEVEFPSAHGVLWDPENEVLWALGMNAIQAYTVTKDHEMIPLENMRTSLPSPGGHDLSPVYGDSDLMWVTTDSNVYQFRKSTGKFEKTYDGWKNLMLLGTVKGIGSFEDGTVVYAQQNGTYREWNTNLVTYGYYNPETEMYELRTREVPGSAFYKLRVFQKDYL